VSYSRPGRGPADAGENSLAIKKTPFSEKQQQQSHPYLSEYFIEA
jgi:hypothetical protein